MSLQASRRWTSLLGLVFTMITLAACCCVGGLDDDRIDTAPAADTPQAPLAVVSAITETGSLNVALDASGSSDADGVIVSYDWDFESDGVWDLLDGGATLDHIYPSYQEYVATVRVTDNDGLMDTAASSPFTLTSAPVPPTAAGTYAVDEENPLLVTLDATGSFASGSSITRYDWDLDGDGEYELQGAGPTPVHTFPDHGTYPVRVRVTDENGLTDTATITVLLAPPQAPVADLQANTEHGDLPDLLVNLNASASHDADGTIVRYDWDLDGDGAYEVSDGEPNQSVVINTSGLHSFSVLVTDNDGLTDSATVEVDANAPPVANLTVAAGRRCALAEIAVDALGSIDPDGTIVRYDWDLDGDNTFETTDAGFQQTVLYDAAGEYRVAVRVLDDDGTWDSTAREFTVDPANQPPTAVITAPGTAGYAPLTVTVDGLASTDPDGAVSGYEWDFDGDGVYGEAGPEADASGQPGPHDVVFNTVGSYSISLQVADNGNPVYTDTETIPVTVYNPGETFDLEVQVTLTDTSQFTLAPDILVRLYDGNPEDGGAVWVQQTVNHSNEEDPSIETVVFEDQMPIGDLWVRFMSPWVEWTSPAEIAGREPYVDLGPINFPAVTRVEVAGFQYKQIYDPGAE